MSKQRFGAGLFLIGAIWFVASFAIGTSMLWLVISALVASAGILVITTFDNQ